MKGLALAALMFAGGVLPAVGQRGGGHAGGFASRGGGMSSGVRSFSSGPRYGAGISSARRGGYAGNGSRQGSWNGNRNRGYRGFGGVPYVFPILNGWVDPGLSGYGNVDGFGDQGYGADYAGGYGPGVAEQDVPGGAAQGYPDPGGYPDQGQAYGPPAQVPYVNAVPYPAAPVVRAAPRPAPVLTPEEAVTLVFRDGRPTEQIHNYALTRTTLVVMDGRRREIPLDQLDLAKTESVNRVAGVEFKLLDDRH